MKQIISLMQKANRAYAQHEGYCSQILGKIEHMIPDGIEPMVFMQTDGLVVSDTHTRNVPVSYILNWYQKNNRRMTYNDFLTLAI